MIADRPRIAWLVLGSAVSAFFVAVLYIVLQAAQTTHAIRDTQQTNTVTQQNTAQTLSIIKSCTTPGQACFERSQKQTAAAVSGLSSNAQRAAAAGVACASHVPPHYGPMYQCILRTLANDHR